MNSLNVLAIEASAVQQNLLARHLAQAGLSNIRFSSTAAAALDQLHQHPADLLFTDLLLPDMRGFALVRRLAGLRHKPALAVVSSQPGVLLDSKCMHARLCGLNVLGQLRKPVAQTDIARLLDSLRQHLAAQGQPPVPQQYYFSREELLAAIRNGEIRSGNSLRLAAATPATQPATVEWQHPQLGNLHAEQFMLAIELNGLQDVLRLSILNKHGLLATYPPYHSAASSKNLHANKLQPWLRT